MWVGWVASKAEVEVPSEWGGRKEKAGQYSSSDSLGNGSFRP